MLVSFVCDILCDVLWRVLFCVFVPECFSFNVCVFRLKFIVWFCLVCLFVCVCVIVCASCSLWLRFVCELCLMVHVLLMCCFVCLCVACCKHVVAWFVCDLLCDGVWRAI